MNYANRRKKLKQQLVAEHSDAMLVCQWANVHYLSGFTGDDSFLLVTTKGDYLLTDFRYIEQVEQECPDLKIIRRRRRSLAQLAIDKLKALKLSRLAFEPASISYAHYRNLREQAGGFKLQAVGLLVEQLRRLKEEPELELIRRSAKTAEQAMAQTRRYIRAGISERELADELEFCLRRLGARASFDIIVAFGQRASLPHACPTDRRLKVGEAVLIDWGARLHFYNSDLTRVFFLAKVSRNVRRIYRVTAEAQSQALSALKNGGRIGTAGRKARAVIDQAGFGGRFGHALGHGIGLEVHELPTVRSQNREVFEPGMVFTVEPGIYIPGVAGVRIEDMVVMGDSGPEVLTSFPKSLDEMVI